MINECKKNELATRYAIVLDDVEYEVFGKDMQNCYQDGNIVGTFIAKTFEFEIENNVDLKEKEFEVYYLVNDERQKIGTFVTIDIKDNDTTRISKIFALDYEIKTQVNYSSALDYESGSITLADVWQECCDLAGLENGNTTFNNSDYVVTSDQFSDTGSLIYDVMREIAKCSLDFIVIGSDDKAYLKWVEETDFIIEEYVELEDKRDTQPITKLIYGQENVEGQEGIALDQNLIDEYGLHQLVINDNLFAITQEQRQYLADSNYDKIKLFGYSSFVAKDTFMPYLKLGDIIQFRTIDGTLTSSVILKKEHKIEYKGVEFKLSAPSITKSTINYVKPKNVDTKLKETQIIADRALNQVDIITKETTTIKDNLSANYYTKEQSNTLTQTANEGLLNTFLTTGGNNKLKNTYFSEYENNELTFWSGNYSVVNNFTSKSGNALILNNGEVNQQVNLPNGQYTMKFKYKKLLSTATASVEYNSKEFQLVGEVGEENIIQSTGDITTGIFDILFTCDTNNGFEIYELMLNEGSEPNAFTQSANETNGNYVTIGKGVQVDNTAINSYTRLDADGLRGFNKSTNAVTFYQTDKGLGTNHLDANSAEIGTLVLKSKNLHNFFSGIGE